MNTKYKGYAVEDHLVGILLFVLLAAAASLGISVYLDGSRNSLALSDTSSLSGLVSQYNIEVGSYPKTLTALTQAQGQYGPWLIHVPTDPWTERDGYKYLYNGTSFIIFSVGKDGAVSSSIDHGIAGDDIGFISR